MNGQQTSKRVSDEFAALIAKHASERTLLEARQHNERIDMQERQAAEVATLQSNEGGV